MTDLVYQPPGELLKLAGMKQAALGKQRQIAIGQLAFLDAIVHCPTGVTIDDATSDLTEPFQDGGQWRGSVTRSLAVAGAILHIGYTASTRPSRHRSTIKVWAMGDPVKFEAKRKELREELEASSPVPEFHLKKKPVAATTGEIKKDQSHVTQ